MLNETLQSAIVSAVIAVIMAYAFVYRANAVARNERAGSAQASLASGFTEMLEILRTSNEIASDERKDFVRELAAISGHISGVLSVLQVSNNKGDLILTNLDVVGKDVTLASKDIAAARADISQIAPTIKTDIDGLSTQSILVTKELKGIGDQLIALSALISNGGEATVKGFQTLITSFTRFEALLVHSLETSSLKTVDEIRVTTSSTTTGEPTNGTHE